MSTPFTDAWSVYGAYVRKSAPMVPSSKVRELEKVSNDLAVRAQIAEDDIAMAHLELDALGVTRLQDNGLTYSLAGRIRILRDEKWFLEKP